MTLEGRVFVLSEQKDATNLKMQMTGGALKFIIMSGACMQNNWKHFWSQFCSIQKFELFEKLLLQILYSSTIVNIFLI